MTEFTRALKADAYKRRRAHEAAATYLTAAAFAVIMACMMVYGLT